MITHLSLDGSMDETVVLLFVLEGVVVDGPADWLCAKLLPAPAPRRNLTAETWRCWDAERDEETGGSN